MSKQTRHGAPGDEFLARMKRCVLLIGWSVPVLVPSLYFGIRVASITLASTWVHQFMGAGVLIGITTLGIVLLALLDHSTIFRAIYFSFLVFATIFIWLLVIVNQFHAFLFLGIITTSGLVPVSFHLACGPRARVVQGRDGTRAREPRLSSSSGGNNSNDGSDDKDGARKAYESRLGDHRIRWLARPARLVWNRRGFVGFPRPRRGVAGVAGSLLVACAIFSPLFIFSAPDWIPGPVKVHVTDAQAINNDLVLYYATSNPDDYTSNRLIEIANRTNVTISIAWTREWEAHDSPGQVGYEIASFVSRANQAGVRIEMFPTFHFNWEDIIPGFMDYYIAFEGWLDRYNITIDYLLWDIEGGSLGSDHARVSALLPGLEYSFHFSTSIAQRVREWPSVRAAMHEVNDRARARGMKVRITTWSAIDELDGDDDLFARVGQPGWMDHEAIDTGYYDYVSQMAYLNGWGNQTHQGNGPVYCAALWSARTHPRKVAVCIGNINGQNYTTIDEVVNDVRVCLAAGADSVRLFNGASWKQGWHDPANNYNGPEWGWDGLEELLVACRTGGDATYLLRPDYQRYTFFEILADAWYDLTGPFF